MATPTYTTPNAGSGGGDSFSHVRLRPSARRFARTRPEAGRFRQARQQNTTADSFVELIADLIPEAPTTDQWRELLAAATMGWNLAVMPTELDSSWSTLSEVSVGVAYEVARRKMAVCPDDKAVIVDATVTETDGSWDVAVSVVSYH